MTTIKLPNGYTIVTEVKDVAIHDRVGFLDLIKTERKRVAQVWAPDGYEHGLAMPFMKLSLEEDTAVQQIADAIDWLNDYYQKSEDEYKALMARMFTKQKRPAT